MDKALIDELASKKEFAELDKKMENFDERKFFNNIHTSKLVLEMKGLRLHGAQHFVNNFFRPSTKYNRLFLYWQTGTGKTLAALSIAKHFKKKRIFIGYTEDIIVQEMIKFPDLGFINEGEQPKKALKKRNIIFYGYITLYKRIFGYTDLGIKNKIDILKIRAGETGSFYKSLISNIDSFIKKKFISINYEFLKQMENSLIIFDEIHNVYNMKEKNRYGIAIYYILNYLKDKDNKSIFLTATPMTTSAREIIDLIQLLIPEQSHIQENKYFNANGVMRPGTPEKIAKIMYGYVSYLKESSSHYPTIIIKGTTIPKIKYLKFKLSKLNKFYVNSIKKAKLQNYNDIKISRDFTSIYDIVLPSGIFNFKKAVEQVGLLKIMDKTIDGQMLDKELLGKYSPKFKNLLDIVSTPGKTFIFHKQVIESGVLLIENILRRNGILNKSDIPSKYTLCAICGNTMETHKGNTMETHKGDPMETHKGDPMKNKHIFSPIRYLMVNYMMDKKERKENMRLYNAPSNTYGHEYMIFIGTKIVREGYNFKSVRRLIITNIPTNVSELIQVFGRVRRRNSHSLLPKDQNYVDIIILVNFYTKNNPYMYCPELLKYKRMMRNFRSMQAIEVFIKQYSINGFVNFVPDKITSLYDIPYTPIISKPTIVGQELANSPGTTYYKDMFGLEDVNTLVEIIELICEYRKIWKLGDLWRNITKNVVEEVYFNQNAIAYDDYIWALYILNSRNKIYFCDPYIIYTKKLDRHCYLRNFNNTNKLIVIPFSTRKIKIDYEQIIDKYKENYYKMFIDENEYTNKSVLLYAIKHNIVKLINIYKKIGAIISDKDKDILNVETSNILYRYKDKVIDIKTGNMYPYDFLGHISKENSTILGFMDNGIFKMRYPVEYINLHFDKYLNIYEKGFVCKGKEIEELVILAKKLSILPKKYNIANAKTSLNKIEFCEKFKNELYFRELNNKDNKKWFYLFFENLPSL